MAGTVRGTFDLNSRPASSALRDIRTEAAGTDVVLEAVGKRLDNLVTDKALAKLEAYQQALQNVNEELYQLYLGARTAEAGLHSLGRVRSTPRVNVDGITQAVAQIEILESRLDAIDRRRAVATVGVRGGATSAARAAATPSSFGGGGGKPGGFPKFSGLGPIPGGPLGAAAVGLALPAGRALVGSGTALLGSAYQGALGAGAVGLSGIGAFGTGIGALASVLIPTISALKGVTTEQTAYTRAVQQYGPNSKEAATAQQQLNMVMSQAPAGVKQFTSELAKLKSFWTKATAPAQQRFLNTASSAFRTARTQIAPQIAPNINALSGVAQTQTNRFTGGFLAGDQQVSFLQTELRFLGRNADEVERITENLVATFEHLTKAANPFFHDFLVWLQQWTQGWATNTRNLHDTRDTISGLVDDTKAWGRLTGDLFKLLNDIFMAGAPQGKSMVNDLDKQLKEWDRWINSNPQKVRQFFKDTVDSTEHMARALGHVAHLLSQLARMLTPLLNQFSDLAGLAASLGPGGLPFLIGGYQGIKGGARTALGGTAAGRYVGAPGGVVPIPVGGRAPAGMPRVAPRGPIAEAPYGAPIPGVTAPVAGTRAAPTGLLGRLGAGGRAAVGGFARTYLPFALAMGALQGVAYPGNANDRFQSALSSTSLGLIPPPTDPTVNAQRFPDWARQLVRTGAGLNPAGMAAAPTKISRARLGAQVLGDPSGFDAPGAKEGSAAALKFYQGYINAARSGRVRSGMKDVTDMFALRQKHGESASKAFANTADDLLKRFDDFRGKAQSQFDDMTASWINDFNKAHPKLRDETRGTMRDVVDQLSKGKDQWAIVSGRIVEINSKNWKTIKDDIVTQSKLAREGANNNLKAITDEATKFLQQLGFSPSAASKLADWQTMTPSQQSKSAARSTRKATPQQAHQLHQPQARGGRAQGSHMMGAQDHIVTAAGDMVAGGELWVNRHTEARIDKLLRPAGTSLDREVRGETKAHSAPVAGKTRSGFANDYAYGGRRFAGGGRGGGSPSITAAAQLATSMGMSVSGGPGYGGIPTSGHAPGSLHYAGLAYDVSGSASMMRAYFLKSWETFQGSINELFYDPMGYYYDQGQRVSGAIGGHSDHVHIGFFPSGAVAKGRVPSGKGGGGAVKQIPPLHPLQTPARGMVPGGVNASNRAQAAGMTQRINEKLRKQGGTGTVKGNFGKGQMSESQIQQLAAQVGMPDPHLMAAIAMAESGGDPQIRNSIGASGLWQILMPMNQSYVHGDVFNPVVNAKAALAILRAQGLSAWEAYTNGAYQQFMARGGRSGGNGNFAGWFGKGGSFVADSPMVFGAGEKGRERVTVEPIGARRGGSGNAVHVENHFHGMQVRSDADIKKLTKEIGKKIAADLEDALARSNGSGVVGVAGG